MQELALSEGALPRHLHTSLFTISTDQRMLTNRSNLNKSTLTQFFFSNLGLLVPASSEFSLFTVQYFTHTLTQRVSCLCLSFFIRQLSRHLVGLWTAENPVAMNLLKRILVRLQIPTLTQRFDTHPMCMAENSSVMMAIQEKCSWM